MKLFISYSRDDKNYVYELAQALKDRSQHDVWIDRRLIAADLWWDTILDNIEACECFVALLTPKFVSSIYCNAELDYALSLQKPILPLMLKSCDMPAPLRKIQTPDISGTSLSDTLLMCTQALYEVRIRRMEGKYPAPERAAGRPSVPTPPANSETISDVYADAEEAAAEGNESLAEKLFNDVIAADPQGFGLVASERLGDLRRERKRAQEYSSITRLIANPNTLKGARSAWKVYVQAFGTDYDPNGYAEKLSIPNAPISVPQSVVESKPLDSVRPPLPVAEKVNVQVSEVHLDGPSESDQKTSVSRAMPISLLIVGGVVVVLVVIIALMTRQPPGNASSPSITGTTTIAPILSATTILVRTTSEPTLSPQAALMTFIGHTGYVYGVAFSPDGKAVLTGSSDKSAKLWDVQNGKVMQTFTGHTDTVNSVAFSPDGKYVLTGSSDKTAKLWDVQSGKLLQTYSGHTSAVTSVAFSHDGSFALTGSYDYTAKMWDVTFQSGKVLRTFTSHTDSVMSVAFSPNGAIVLTGSGDGTAKSWDDETGKVLQTFTVPTDHVTSVAYSPDGRYVLTGNWDNTAKMWDVKTDMVVQTFAGHEGLVHSVAFSPDGKYILTGSGDGTAKLWASAISQ